MDLLSKIFWTVLALEAAFVLVIIKELYPGTPKGGFFASSETVMALMMFLAAAGAIAVVAGLYLGGVGLWFHFKHSPFALAALALPVFFMLSK